MGVHSGKFGVVDGISTVRNWAISDVMAPQPYVASNTLFGTGRVKGIEEWSGSFGVYGSTPPVMPGESFSFLGYTAPTNDVTGNGMRYSGTALAENTKISWNWGSGEIIAVTVDFKGHLALAAAVGAEIFDNAAPTVPPIAGTKITYSADGNAWTELENLLSAELTITNALKEYVNSSTASGGRIWKGQKSGPLDWALSITQQDVQRASFAKGDNVQLRLYVNDTEYYELKWGLVGEFSGLTVDRETGAIMQQTINLNMSGFNGSTGHIKLPGGSQWWPATEPGTGT